MMDAYQRIEAIKQCLVAALSPTHLDVRDDSAKHIGHIGAAGGAGHYAIVIRSPLFAGKNQIARHRLVYDALKELMPSEIHALQLDTRD
jgi:BolA family transcriptional regulator, general stress-responsive regulator